MARIIMLGGPGSGKGTQAKRLSEKLNLPHISTGEIIRKEVSAATELGQVAKDHFEQGQLVPDELVMEMVRKRLHQDDCKLGFILDGYPATLAQAHDLDRVFGTMSTKKTIAIMLDVPDTELLARVVGRRYCPQCGMIYHVMFNRPQQEGVCDRDGAALELREDDNQTAIMSRLHVYHQVSGEIFAYYQAQHMLKNVPGSGTPDETFAEIERVLP